MTRLIGPRWKSGDRLSRGVLIRRLCFLFGNLQITHYLQTIINKQNRNVLCWRFGDRATPVLIPNTEVKPVSADGSPCLQQAGLWARVGRRQHKAFLLGKTKKYTEIFSVYFLFHFSHFFDKILLCLGQIKEGHIIFQGFWGYQLF